LKLRTSLYEWWGTSIIKALKKIDTNLSIYNDLGKVPFFNSDLNNHSLTVDNSPILVQELRKAINSSDGIIISTPEYAFEIPGVLKNALDWLVSSAEIVHKPVAIISASTSAMGGDKANTVLLNLVNVLTGNTSKELTLTVPMVNKKIDDKGEIIDKLLTTELHTLLDKLKFKIKKENNV